MSLFANIFFESQMLKKVVCGLVCMSVFGIKSTQYFWLLDDLIFLFYSLMGKKNPSFKNDTLKFLQIIVKTKARKYYLVLLQYLIRIATITLAYDDCCNTMICYLHNITS